ncbi:hypothetical protein PCANC_25506 [Puccinia coronata f. sp. avenae]|uniref:Uncharacterized protein n=1 Tax=Puccinia coronata f. sp. avenae TaxID=200324 RepID=A0A2N5SDV4_9BASI|nr:hypothetical protein PCANC_27868 [Puccinia coronata f. sp. avenae]PLW11345.1 hypothetical protein PCASD_25517 [Puccinia coronata f. sp. avenae]PLW34334.1 hypothetical protein PCANC_25506 [Puccinia coronata f. sp. avenae]
MGELARVDLGDDWPEQFVYSGQSASSKNLDEFLDQGVPNGLVRGIGPARDDLTSAQVQGVCCLSRSGPSSLLGGPGKLLAGPSSLLGGPSSLLAGLSSLLGGLSSLLAGPSSLLAGPSSLLAGPSSLLAGPSSLLAGSSSLLAGSSSLLAGPSSLLAGSSSLLAGPSSLLQAVHMYLGEQADVLAQQDIYLLGKQANPPAKQLQMYLLGEQLGLLAQRCRCT